jgi:mycothiol synthase
MDLIVQNFSSRPTDAQLEALRTLANTATRVDAHPPFNDQTWAALRAGDHGVRGVLVPSGDALAAAAVVTDLNDTDVPDGAAGPGVLVEFVVHPIARQRGLGSELAQWALDAAPEGAVVQAWSHGGHPAAARLASEHGLESVRELWVMTVDPDTVESLPEPSLPRSVSLDRFVVGRDEDAWLKVNAAAFDFHPEQGKMMLSDLRAREAEDWFDPGGFFLAHKDDGELLGFHWTKLSRAEDGSVTEGEVYAVGIAPSAQGMGLGRALTIAGMKYLAAAGAPRIVLYVEADNEPAVNLYRSLGFTVASSDVLYERPESY